MSLFNNIPISELQNIETSYPKWNEAVKIVKQWQHSLKIGKLHTEGEKQQANFFINDFFGRILDYENEINVNRNFWHIQIETSTDLDKTRPDAVLGFYDAENLKLHRAVIEMKGVKISLDAPQNRRDFKESPVAQAFSYQHKLGKNCTWVIVSNVLETRLYHALDAKFYEKFELKTLDEPKNLARFIYLLGRGQLFNNQINQAATELLLQAENEVFNLPNMGSLFDKQENKNEKQLLAILNGYRIGLKLAKTENEKELAQAKISEYEKQLEEIRKSINSNEKELIQKIKVFKIALKYADIESKNFFQSEMAKSEKQLEEVRSKINDLKGLIGGLEIAFEYLVGKSKIDCQNEIRRLQQELDFLKGITE